MLVAKSQIPHATLPLHQLPSSRDDARSRKQPAKFTFVIARTSSKTTFRRTLTRAVVGALVQQNSYSVRQSR
jgi:hypothetical protein